MGVWIPIIVVTTGLVSVIGSYLLKYKKIDNEQKGLSKEDKKKLDDLIEQNQQLHTRVQNLETIITSMDKELLSLKTFDESLDIKKVEEIANHLKDKK